MCCTITSTAAAARKPTLAERTAIIRVTKSHIDTSDCCAVISRIKILNIRVSTVSPRWAAISFDGFDEAGQDVGAATATLHKGSLTGR
jgi:hypothetical protein